MLNIVLFGPPGAGKGTQAELLKSYYGLNHISTGSVIRREMRAGSALGKSVEAYIAKGELAPDALVIDLITDYVEKHKDAAGNIYDGFPRTTVQAEAFDKIMNAHGIPVDMMLSLEVPDAMLIERLVKRAQTSGRADDSDVDVIRHRIEVYKAQTRVVADYYARQGKYVAIDGTGTIEETFAKLRAQIDKLGKKVSQRAAGIPT